MRQLIRFFKTKEYAEQFAGGSIYMNSLSYFWMKGFEDQRDFLEGVGCTISKNALKGFDSDFIEAICLDPAYRFDAYKYCNICSFYRVDIDENKKIILLPHPTIDQFGEYVAIIIDEAQFLLRIHRAIKEHDDWKYLCGDVRYIPRIDPHTMRPFTGNSIDFLIDRPLNIDELIITGEKIRTRDCFVKIPRYSYQKEWRICLLRHPYEEKYYRLEVGDLSDLVTIVKTTDLRYELICRHKPCQPGIVPEQFQSFYGNINRKKLNEVITHIDRMVWLNATIG